MIARLLISQSDSFYAGCKILAQVPALVCSEKSDPASTLCLFVTTTTETHCKMRGILGGGHKPAGSGGEKAPDGPEVRQRQLH